MARSVSATSNSALSSRASRRLSSRCGGASAGRRAWHVREPDHPLEQRLEPAHRRLPGRLTHLGGKREGLCVSALEEEALRAARLRLAHEPLCRELLEERERLVEEPVRLLEPSCPRRCSAQVGERGARAERPSSRSTRAQHHLERSRRLLEVTLVGEDLALVVDLNRAADDVARPLLGRPALRVVRGGLVPASLVVGMDAEIAQHHAEAPQVVELLVDGASQLEVVETVLPARGR